MRYEHENGTCYEFSLESTSDSSQNIASIIHLPIYSLSTSVSPSEGGSVGFDTSGSSGNAGEIIQLIVSASNGYEFTSWSGDGILVGCCGCCGSFRCSWRGSNFSCRLSTVMLPFSIAFRALSTDANAMNAYDGLRRTLFSFRFTCVTGPKLLEKISRRRALVVSQLTLET